MALRDEGIATRVLNEGVTIALKAAADHWLQNYLPLHLQTYSGAKYGYKWRKTGYNLHKARAQYIGIWERVGRKTQRSQNVGVVNPNYGLARPADWVYTGALRDHVLGNAKSGHLLQQAKAPQAAKRITLTIPIGFPHPVRSEFTSKGGNPEIVKINPNEAREMNAVARRAFANWMQDNPGKYKGTATATRRATRRQDFIDNVVGRAF